MSFFEVPILIITFLMEEFMYHYIGTKAAVLFLRKNVCQKLCFTISFKNTCFTVNFANDSKHFLQINIKNGFYRFLF